MLMGDLNFITYKARSRARRHNHHTPILCCRAMGGDGGGHAAINTVQWINISCNVFLHDTMTGIVLELTILECIQMRLHSYSNIVNLKSRFIRQTPTHCELRDSTDMQQFSYPWLHNSFFRWRQHMHFAQVCRSQYSDHGVSNAMFVLELWSVDVVFNDSSSRWSFFHNMFTYRRLCLICFL